MKASPHCSLAGTQGGPLFKIVCPNVLVFCALCQEVQLCFHCEQGTVETVFFPWAARIDCAYPLLWPHTHSQVCLCLPPSMARLCSWSLYFVNVDLRFLSDQGQIGC